MKRNLMLLLLLLTTEAMANFDLSQLNLGLGMVNSSFQETPSGLNETNASKEKPSSGSVQTISALVGYEKFINHQYSVGANFSFPLIQSGTGSQIYGGATVNRYFKSLSSTGDFHSNGSTLKIIPKWRYYAGLDLGATVLIYNTLKAKKTDTLIGIGAHVGANRSAGENWGYRGEIGISRDTGFNNQVMTMKAFGGIFYNL